MEPKQQTENLEAPQTLADARRPYTPPVLEEYGDVRDLTLGGSPGSGDSISPSTKQPL